MKLLVKIPMTVPNGLFLSHDFITSEEEKSITQWLDNQQWSTALQRRTQHYGYEYDYKSKIPKPTIPMSGPILDISNRISKAGLMNPTQCIINEYFHNQGIAPHTDSPMFGPIVIGVTLGDPCNMIFQNDTEKFVAFLPPRSLLLLKDEVRNLWKHSIPKTEKIILPTGEMMNKNKNYRRISITYRTVIQGLELSE